MIEFDIKTIKERALGRVRIEDTRKFRNGKRYYEASYKDANVTHTARVLHDERDGVLPLIAKASKALEKARRAFYSFPEDKVRWIAKRGDGVVCVAQEEDMQGNKSDSHGLMPVICPQDIPERYRPLVMEWMIGQGAPVVDGVTAIYLSDFNRWLRMQFVDEVGG